MIPLSSRDSSPVWDQVSRGLRTLLEKGAFLPGERLPSPEALACQMVLSPVSVRRAYEELERQGVLARTEDAAYTVAEGRKRP